MCVGRMRPTTWSVIGLKKMIRSVDEACQYQMMRNRSTHSSSLLQSETRTHIQTRSGIERQAAAIVTEYQSACCERMRRGAETANLHIDRHRVPHNTSHHRSMLW